MDLTLALTLALSRARHSGRLARVALLAAMLIVAGLRWPEPPLLASPEGRVDVSGEVESATCERSARCRVVLGEASLDGQATGARVVVRVTREQLGAAGPGDEVTVSASVWGERVGSNPGFDPPWSPRAHRWRGVASSRLVVRARAAPSARRALLERLQLRDPIATQLYRALLLGDRRGLDPALRDAFVDSGTAHLLAISGLHLAVVGWGLYRLALALLLMSPARWLRRLPAGAAACACGLIWVYVSVIAPSQATRRAAVALTVVFVGAVLARRADGARTLCVAAIALLMWQPDALLGPSFQLSFAAAASLVVGWPIVRRGQVWLEEPGRLASPRAARVAVWLLAALGASGLTSAATAPLALAWFGQWAPLGVLVNVVAVPLVSLVVVPVGFAWLVLAAVAPAAAEVIAWLPGACAALLVDLVRAWAHALGPSTAAAWPHLLGVAVSIFMVVALVRPRAGALGLLGCAVVAGVWAAQPASLTMTALDVRHGDALLLQLPGGQSALIDTGGRIGGLHASDAVARQRLVPALTRLGVGRLDLLVITHADADHVGAAAELLERMEVSEVWLPWCSLAARAVQRLARRAGASGATVRTVRRGRPFAWGGALWRPLWPTGGLRRSDGSCELGRNHGSLVLSVSYASRRILLTGDVDAAAEEQLLRLGADALSADVLKVAHHGSRTSSSAVFLDAVRPSVAVVSGVARAGPMPPHQSVLSELHGRRIATRVTGRDGAVEVQIRADGGLEVRPRFGLGATFGARTSSPHR